MVLCACILVGYNESVDASIKNVFATAAMRFGHTFLPATIKRADDHYHSINGTQTPLSQVTSPFLPSISLVQTCGLVVVMTILCHVGLPQYLIDKCV